MGERKCTYDLGRTFLFVTFGFFVTGERNYQELPGIGDDFHVKGPYRDLIVLQVGDTYRIKMSKGISIKSDC